jgi:hypothetical protein
MGSPARPRSSSPPAATRRWPWDSASSDGAVRLARSVPETVSARATAVVTSTVTTWPAPTVASPHAWGTPAVQVPGSDQGPDPALAVGPQPPSSVVPGSATAVGGQARSPASTATSVSGAAMESSSVSPVLAPATSSTT